MCVVQCVNVLCIEACVLSGVIVLAISLVL